MIFIIPLLNICYLNRVKETANNKLHLFSRRVLHLWVKTGSDLAVQNITPLKINQECFTQCRINRPITGVSF